MFSIVELIGIYGDINTRIIRDGEESLSREFRNMTDTLLGLKHKLESITIESDSKVGTLNLRSASMWNFYKKDLLSETEAEVVCKMKIPKITQNDQNIKILAEISNMCNEF